MPSRPLRVSALRVLLLAAAVAACGSQQPKPAAPSRSEAPPPATLPLAPAQPPLGKLPEGATPLAYRIELQIDPSQERFAGAVEIDVRVAAPVRRIYLHALDLDVSHAEASEPAGGWQTGHLQCFDRTGVCAFEVAQALPAGDHTLRFRYSAPFDRQLKGLYRVDHGGKSYAFTQLEAISARQVFPSFDEPRFKTPFEVAVIAPAALRVIGNTAERSAELLPGNLRRARFARTEPLPTYLIALAVGELDVVEAPPIAPNDVRQRPVPLRGVAVAGKGDKLAYALQHTPAILAELERYFGVEYPYDKLDIIAVPDFASGAMENAGAVTFREPLLLLDSEHATEGQRRGFWYVMAHELAHQWFGNLVTMPWWDDLWLNEAFATWMGHRVVDALRPEQMAAIAMLSDVHSAMGRDSLQSARVIRQPIESSHDISNAFDAITYSKGGGVLAMIERYVGAETFRDGMRRYMGRHRFGTATSSDLIASIGEAAGRDLQPVFTAFLQQPGVPSLNVTPRCESGRGSMLVEQSRHRPLGSSIETERSWTVPVCVRLARGNQPPEPVCSLVEAPQQSIDLGAGCADWVMPNADAAGYYRFVVSPEELQRLQRGYAKLNTRERLALADSLAAGFSAGIVDVGTLLAMAKTLAQSPERLVATAPMAWLGFLSDHVVAPPDQAKLARLGRSLYLARAKQLGWEPRPSEDGETRLLRASLLSYLALDVRDESLRREARKRGERYVGFGADGALHAEAITSDLVGVALSVAVQEGGAPFFDHLLSVMRTSQDAVLRDRALAALAGSLDPELAQRALQLTLDPDIRVNEALTPLAVQLRSRERRDAAWTWLVENIDAVVARIGATRGAYLPWLATNRCTPEQAHSLRELFTPRLPSLQGAPRNLDGAIEALTTCVAKADFHRDATAAYLRRVR